MRSLKLLLLVLTIFAQHGHITGYSSGAPDSKCGSMLPAHGQTPKDNANSPYTVEVNSLKLTPGSEVTVDLKGSESFKGFIVTARDDEDNIVGAFETVGDAAKYVNCGGKPQTGVTHVAPSGKSSVRLKWRAPSDFSGNVKILATFVKSYNEYFVKVASDNIQVSQESGGGGFIFPESSSAEPESEPEPETEPEAEPEAEAEAEAEAEPEPEAEGETASSSSGYKSTIYEGCGIKKTCLGHPLKCVADESCSLVASWKKNADGEYEWELFQQLGSSKYVAVGLSSDTKMGDELVLSCGSSQSVEVYWNNGKSPQKLSDVKGVRDYKFSSNNGESLCRLTTKQILEAGDHKVDLSEKHHILMAGGQQQTGVSYHLSDRMFTDEPISLERIQSLSGGRDPLLLFRIHGLLMLAAWVGCSGAGMILARYFKKTWRGRQVMGKDIWFVMHRLLMSLVVLLSLAAVILVLIEVQVEPLSVSSLQLNAHPVIGLICVILAIIQPFMAACRPHPGTTSRPLFNWAHWGVGNAAYLFGVVAIFLAGSLAKTNLASTEWWNWLILAYVIFHFLVHMILSLVMAKEERSSGVVMDTQMADLRGKREMMAESDEREVGSSVRKVLLSVYLLGVWSITAALIVAVFQA